MIAGRQPYAARIALALLALCAAWLLIAPLYRMGLWLEQPNEGWNATHALNAFSRELYPPRGSFIINNYPPLWFYLIGALSRSGLDPIFAGRVIAFAAYLATALGIAVILRRMQATSTAAVVAALSFVLIVAGLLEGYVGLAEPQMLAHALVLFGAVLLIGARTRRDIILAAVLTALGLLTKQVVIALPLASLIWLVIYRRTFVLPWLATGLVFGAAAFAGLVVLYGHAFIDNLLFPRVFTWSTLGKNVALITKAAVPLVVFASIAWRLRNDERLVFASLTIAASVGELLLFGGARGVSINVVFDLVIAASIGLGLAWDRVDRHVAARHVAIIAALIVRVAIGVPYGAVALPFDANVRARLQQQSATLLGLRDRTRQIEGPVACETLSVCLWAGKRNGVDLWKLHYETTLGPFMDTPALLARISRREFGAIVLFGTPPVADRQWPGLAASLSAAYPQEQTFGVAATLFTPEKSR